MTHLGRLTSEVDRHWPAEGFARVPSWVYSDPAIFKREMELFFAGETWNFVGLECEVPQPGTFKRAWIGTKPVIVIRDEHGDIVVLENRCAHRGPQICWQNRGEAKDFTCPYHQWNFDLRGNLVGLPFRRGALKKGGMPADFDLSKHNIKQLRVALRGGAIWATFDETTASFEDYCGAEVLAEVDAVFPGKPLVLLGYHRQLIPANWKLYVENLKDPYHATLLHTFYITFGLWRADNRSECHLTKGGMHSVMISHNEGKKVTDATSQMSRFRGDFEVLDKETVTPRPEFNRGRVGGPWIFPSCTVGIQANSLKVRLVIPKSPTEFELLFTFFGYADDDADMTRHRVKQANLTGPAGLVSMDDSEMLTQCQIGANAFPESQTILEMGDRDLESTDHMVTEVMIRGFYKYYREAMGL